MGVLAVAATTWAIGLPGRARGFGCWQRSDVVQWRTGTWCGGPRNIWHERYCCSFPGSFSTQGTRCHHVEPASLLGYDAAVVAVARAGDHCFSTRLSLSMVCGLRTSCLHLGMEAQYEPGRGVLFGRRMRRATVLWMSGSFRVGWCYFLPTAGHGGRYEFRPCRSRWSLWYLQSITVV